jgi:protein-disulfide isomerase
MAGTRARTAALAIALTSTACAASRPGPDREPDPGARYAVEVDGHPWSGPAQAKVTLVELYTFNCESCAKMRATVAALRRQYGDDMRVVMKSFVAGEHDSAAAPAIAACVASRQGMFQDLEPLLWERGGTAGRELSREDTEAAADEAGVDRAMLRAELDGEGECKKQLARDRDELLAIGVFSAPSFFINGRFLFGEEPLSSFTKLIDEELARANGAIDAGTKLDEYYRISVLGPGRKSR